MKQIIIEIFCEEIPENTHVTAEDNLKKLFCEELQQNNILIEKPETIVTWSTPRRIGIKIDGVEKSQKTIYHEIKGPNIKIDKNIIPAFLKKHNATKNQLVIKTLPKGEFYFIKKLLQQPNIEKIIATAITKTIFDFKWPEYMLWGKSNFRWIRPIRNILAVFDGKILDVEIAGIKANDITYGHPLSNPGEIKIKDFCQYESELEKNKVIIKRSKRKKIILEKANKIATENQMQLIEDEQLIEWNVGIVEYPVPIIGRFHQKYLKLPQKVITEILKNHLKCLGLTKDGKIAPAFIAVANIKTKDKQQNIINGYQKVVETRLDDGIFSLQQDLKLSLEKRQDMLKNRIYHEKLGSLYQKAQRIKNLAREIAIINHADIEQTQYAAQIAFFDLSTRLVAEFPKLQGYIAAQYAAIYQQKTIVINAIEQVYLPNSENSPLPQTPEGVAIALADKIDTISGFFAINQIPSGSKDPFALRRAALGIIRIAVEKNISFEIQNLAEISLQTYQKQNLIKINNLQQITKQIEMFCDKRYSKWKNSNLNKNSNLHVNTNGDYLRKNILEKSIQQENKSLAEIIKRIFNIINIEEKKNKHEIQNYINIKLLKQKEEITLFYEIEKVEKDIQLSVKKKKFLEALNNLAKLQKPITKFFENVLINHQENEIKANRMALLNKLRKIIFTIADFSALQK